MAAPKITLEFYCDLSAPAPVWRDGGPVDIEELPISPELERELREHQGWYERTYQVLGDQPDGFLHAGERLRERLQQELGDAWLVCGPEASVDDADEDDD